MATDATFDNQLQALATATANFAADKDATIKNTIITALGGSTQSGGSADITWTVSEHLPKNDVVMHPYYSNYETIERGVRLYFTVDGYYIDVTY